MCASLYVLSFDNPLELLSPIKPRLKCSVPVSEPSLRVWYFLWLVCVSFGGGIHALCEHKYVFLKLQVCSSYCVSPLCQIIQEQSKFRCWIRVGCWRFVVFFLQYHHFKDMDTAEIYKAVKRSKQKLCNGWCMLWLSLHMNLWHYGRINYSSEIGKRHCYLFYV